MQIKTHTTDVLGYCGLTPKQYTYFYTDDPFAESSPISDVVPSLMAMTTMTISIAVVVIFGTVGGSEMIFEKSDLKTLILRTTYMKDMLASVEWMV
uniref:Uncharacterized protein n=1 Tax=Megaselia scalaris TaxID=36166 RepID=T1GRD0_MEGSC